MTKIYCKRNNNNGLDFILKERRVEFYLFSQKWHRGVEEYFKDGVSLDEAIRHGKTRKDRMIHKVKTKLPMYIRHIEKESGMTFLEQSKRRLARAA